MTPPLLDRVVRRCLAKDPDGRWQSADDLAVELRWIGDGLRGTAKVSEPSAHLRRRERLAGALSVGAAAALGILVASWWQAGNAPTASSGTPRGFP